MFINKEKRNEHQPPLKENFESKHSKSNATPKKPNKQTEAKTENLDNSSFFFQEEASLSADESESEESNIKKEIREEDSEQQKNEGQTFQTVDEIIDTLFPTIKDEFGEEIKDFFLMTGKMAIPLLSLKDFAPTEFALTPEQEKLRRKLGKEKSLEFQKVTPKHWLSLEEEIELEEKLNIIRAKYIPKYWNILNKKQQKEAARLYEEIILHNQREEIKSGAIGGLSRINDLKRRLQEGK